MDSFLCCSILLIVSSIVVLWSAGALYFDGFGGSAYGAAAAIAWLLLWAALFTFWAPIWQSTALLIVATSILAGWWFSQQPSQHRDWDPHFAQLARVTLDGDDLTIANVRSSDYLAIGQSTPRFENRRYRLSELIGADALVCTWGAGWMSHPMFVFDFGPLGRVCISIEGRRRLGQEFSLLRSLYRQQELMYVVCDERDAILRRTKWQADHDVYLYRLWSEPVVLRQFFLAYANRINALAQTPRWYHGLTTNCTTSIYAQGRGNIRWAWRILFNGSLDKLLYDRGMINQQLPFVDLKMLSRINDAANRAPEKGFGESIRRELPGYKVAERTAALEVSAS